MGDIEEAVRDVVGDVADAARKLALETAAELCDDLADRGMGAAACAVAIRMLRKTLDEPEAGIWAEKGGWALIERKRRAG